MLTMISVKNKCTANTVDQNRKNVSSTDDFKMFAYPINMYVPKLWPAKLSQTI